MKTCSGCNLTKSLEDFSLRKSSSDGLQSKCKVCCAKYRKDNREQIKNYLQSKREQNREHYRELDRRYSRKKTLKKYGLTEEQYGQMVGNQEGKCLICFRVPTDNLVVDHCHETGIVRGLLCRKCNAAIGALDDSPDLLKRAITYLEM